MTKSQSKKSVCVYCAHRDGAKSSYINAARDTGALIARLDMRLVYGAGDIGLMGAVADAAMDAGAETFGVIPPAFVAKRGRQARSYLLRHYRKHARTQKSNGHERRCIRPLTWWLRQP